MFRRKVRSVLLVDFDNIAAQLGHTDFVDSIPRWLAWLVEPLARGWFSWETARRVAALDRVLSRRAEGVT